jgi:hypothetical protein
VSGFKVPRHRSGPRVEPPAWVRSCNVADWHDDQADAQWAAANQWIVEHDPGYWQQILDWRAHQRWNKARLAWYDQHPDAKHPVEELLERAERDRRAGYFR